MTRRHRRGPTASPDGAELPAGVRPLDWAREKHQVQNPRIRAYLGCLRKLETVLDSNYAILHCSPRRLRRIWAQLYEVCDLMRSELEPTLRRPSVIPKLEGARRRAEAGFDALDTTVLGEVYAYPRRLGDEHLAAARKLLCVSMGKIYDFLRDTLGEIVANDPRSAHDADYFLSRRFAQDIEESEWLYSLVWELRVYLDGLERACSAELEKVLDRMRRDRMIPYPAAWEQTRKVLEMLVEDLTPRLKEVLSLRGVRYADVESLEGYAFAIPHYCRCLSEVYAAARASIDWIKSTAGATDEGREQSVTYLIGCHEIFAARMSDLLAKLGTAVRDLATYVPTWLASIEKRRCLMLTKYVEDGGAAPHRGGAMRSTALPRGR